MAQTTTVNIRVDKDVKREAEKLFSSLGMNTSTAVNMFFRQALMEKAIPFQPKVTWRHVPLKERLNGFNGQYEFEEWDTGEPIGSEIIE